MALFEKKLKISASGLASVISNDALRDLKDFFSRNGINSDQFTKRIEIASGYLFEIWLALLNKYDLETKQFIMDVVTKNFIDYLDVSNMDSPGQEKAALELITARINEYCGIANEKTGGDFVLRFSIQFYKNVFRTENVDAQQMLGNGMILGIFHKCLVDFLGKFKVVSTL